MNDADRGGELGHSDTGVIISDDQTVAAALAAMSEGQRREVLKDLPVMYSPRRGEVGWAKPPAMSAVLSGVVVNVHNSECCDVKCIVGVNEDGTAEERVFVSCFLAGTRDTKPGDAGTFEVV